MTRMEVAPLIIKNSLPLFVEMLKQIPNLKRVINMGKDLDTSNLPLQLLLKEMLMT